uniref:Uncharacterized protein n=1 Tax=Onchocerca volvulus TaxID=6282 RepID=A0A8R1U0C0_ONCVO
MSDKQYSTDHFLRLKSIANDLRTFSTNIFPNSIHSLTCYSQSKYLHLAVRGTTKSHRSFFFSAFTHITARTASVNVNMKYKLLIAFVRMARFWQQTYAVLGYNTGKKWNIWVGLTLYANMKHQVAIDLHTSGTGDSAGSWPWRPRKRVIVARVRVGKLARREGRIAWIIMIWLRKEGREEVQGRRRRAAWQSSSERGDDGTACCADCNQLHLKACNEARPSR